eukprot:jgi/Ulvmu1/10226/UM060_0026.1
MEVQKASIEDVFRKYTRLSKDRVCFVIDVRPYKDWKRRHLLLSYCVRLSSNGRALVDYSKNRYDQKWTQDVWWNSDVVIIGEAGLKRDHEVATFLANEAKCNKVSVCREGIGAFEAAYPFLVGQSLNAHRGLVYPSPVAPHLFLGNWANAEDSEKLKDLRIGRVLTVHNDPQKLKLPGGIRHMSITAPDLPTTDIAKFFPAAYTFIEEAVSSEKPVNVLLHCGAGASRSAAICASYFMRKHMWPAARAIVHLLSYRSAVCPNEGFWRQLCAFEEVLGIPKVQRSDPNAPPVMSEAYGDLGPIHVSAEAAGNRVQVDVRDAGDGSGKRARSRERELDRAPEEGKKARPEGGGVSVSVRIDVLKDGESVTEIKLPDMQPLQVCTFGRSPDASVPLEHPSLSRIHAQLEVGLRGELRLMDRGSVHGTNINGVWVKPKQPKALEIGSKFRLGASSRTYCIKEVNIHR